MIKHKIHSYIMAFALLGATTACEPDLTVPLEGEIVTEQALSDPAAMRKILNGIYQMLGNTKSYGGRIQVANELLGDDIDGTSLTGDLGAIYNRTTSIFGSYKNELFGEPYIAIYRANTVLENLSIVEDPQLREQLEGEAKFLRAISHFALVRLWAQPFVPGTDNAQLGIPLRISSEGTAGVRASVGQVYAQIIQDLKEAADLLPTENAPFANEWAAKGFLAKVYFQMNDFNNAYNYANDVIQNSSYSFNPDTEEYTLRYSLQESDEAVFVIYGDQQANAAIGGEFRNQFRSDLTGVPNLRIAPNFYNLATSNANDARNVWYSNELKPGNLVLTKFNAPYFNVPLVTITELKLIRAESAAELNQNLDVAIIDVNDIITRAYGSTSPRLLPQNASSAVIRQRVREERRLELVGEGDRGQELKRRGALGENVIVRGAPYNCPGAILQFPQGEIANSAGFEKNAEGGCN